MQKEFEFHRKEAASCKSDLETAMRVTDEVVQPLQDQLAELEEKLREAQAKINSTKSQIMRNDITIQNFISRT